SGHRRYRTNSNNDDGDVVMTKVENGAVAVDVSV
ncbi:hypothetical protein A2U01_0075074, partial [Trifolium medium]|nr:hypothetical protein [Trifolium medium]